MNLKPFVTNPYMEGIYASFRGERSDADYGEIVASTIERVLNTRQFEVLKLETGVGLAIVLDVGHGRKVHVKIVRGHTGHQRACCDVQRFLVSRHFPCTVPIGEAVEFLDCSLQLEEFNDEGEYRDSHDPSVMKIQAQSLATLHSLLDEYRADAERTGKSLDAIPTKFIPTDKVWNNPPQSVFSFDGDDSGDEFIRDKAVAAKSIFEEDRGRPKILSHEDWSNKHFRFKGDEISVIYDWDSVVWVDDLYTVGLAASTFTATWYYPTKVFPLPAEADAFVQAYAAATQRCYSAEELRVISAYSAYTIAYIARCVFAYNKGSIEKNDIEAPFNEIHGGQYF